MKKLDKDTKNFGRDYGEPRETRKTKAVPTHYYVGQYNVGRPSFDDIIHEDSRIKAAYQDYSRYNEF